jgi:hypothetical protein
MASLLDLFLEQEADPQVARLLRDAAKLQHGERYFVFNRFNVGLDLESRTATIEDELDPESELSLPLEDLIDRLPAP